MMKKTIFTTITLAAATILLSITSCKKRENEPSRHDRLVGAWKQTETGKDDNGNGVWDATEVTPVATSSATTLLFNADGTGTATMVFLGFPVSGNLAWELADNDNDLKVTVTIASMPVTTLNYTFVNFSASEISVQGTGTVGTTFDKYSKL